ncbi:T-cell immunoreceptor with Ig and ITIM domains-like [Pristis pectinata]|uniref:T-cell immunoreceptor with Ig and ITIM domains-like n=1 Tax=Pristis pectinata TaxID=685728 RepID=UPI00223E02FF|nr:T-cell immunoreceptor with Ig and ITIM domains-like [Pristis pectinata]
MIRTAVICLLIVSGIQTKELETSESVTAMEGSSAVLQCASSNEGLQLVLVEWEKSINKTKLVVYHVSTNKTTLYGERIGLEVKGQRSTITIKGVLTSDKGWYFCILHTYPAGKLMGKIYLDVKDKETSSNMTAYIITGVVLAVIAIGILFLLLCYVHQRKSRIHLPNQINVILQNTSSANNVDTARQPNKPTAANLDGEDTSSDYFTVALRSSL